MSSKFKNVIKLVTLGRQLIICTMTGKGKKKKRQFIVEPSVLIVFFAAEVKTFILLDLNLRN